MRSLTRSDAGCSVGMVGGCFLPFASHSAMRRSYFSQLSSEPNLPRVIRLASEGHHGAFVRFVAAVRRAAFRTRHGASPPEVAGKTVHVPSCARPPVTHRRPSAGTLRYWFYKTYVKSGRLALV